MSEETSRAVIRGEHSGRPYEYTVFERGGEIGLQIRQGDGLRSVKFSTAPELAKAIGEALIAAASK